MNMFSHIMMAASFACAALPAAAQGQGPILVDAAEIYCSDAARPGFSSFGVNYARSMPSYFGNGLSFCRVDMLPSEGPAGGATLGWRHDDLSGTTSVWCQAKAATGSAVVRARFELYALPAGQADARCNSLREGRLP